MKNNSVVAFFGAVLVFGCNSSYAEVVLDGSLGRSGQLAGPNYNIDAAYGAQQGSNVFHSFSSFNVNKGESANFTGPASITNIVGRVTGGEASNIDGTVKSSIAGASLWLVNPAGIVFGENASINVDGSFHASTADYLVLNDGSHWSTNSATGGTLSVADPIGFGFLAAHPVPIFAANAKLTGTPGKEISLVAGSVNLSGSTLTSANGRINLAAMNGVGEVSLVEPAGIQSSHIATSTNNGLGEVTLSNSSLRITDAASATRGGDVYILGGRILVDNASIIQHSNDAHSGGVIHLSANEVSIDGGLVQSETIGVGEGATIVVSGANVSVLNASTDLATVTSTGLVSKASGKGAGGDIYINSSGLVTVAGEGGTTIGGVLRSFASGEAKGGDININAKHVAVTDNGKIFTSTFFNGGTSGSINIAATESVRLTGSDSKIETQTFGSADAGGISINVKAKNFVLSDEAQLSTDSFSTGQGAGINISVENMEVSRGAVVNARTFDATGKGINIAVADNLSVKTDGSISTDTFNDGVGSDIRVNATNVALTDGGRISASAKRNGPAGEVNIVAANEVRISGSGKKVSGIFSESGDPDPAFQPGPGQAALTGKGGDIVLNAKNVILENGAVLSAGAINKGNAGSILINAQESMTMVSSAIQTKAVQSAGGNITVGLGKTLEMTQSEITASANGVSAGDNGGNVTVQGVQLAAITGSPATVARKPGFIIQSDSNITARANAGNGGNITLASQQVVSSTDSVVDASSQKGIDGEVLIEAPMQDMSAAVVNLNTGLLDLSGLLSSPCAVLDAKNRSSFVVKKQYYLPPAPDAYDSARNYGQPAPSTAATNAVQVAYLAENFAGSIPSQECMSHETN